MTEEQLSLPTNKMPSGVRSSSGLIIPLSLEDLSDDSLLASTETAVETERLSTLNVITHLHEIERRKLYLARGYTSLHRMLREYFKYCDGSAQLRIDAMQLYREVPELEAKLENGEVSLTAASQLRKFFRAEAIASKPYSHHQKLTMIENCEGKSAREVQRQLASINTAVLKTESAFAVSATQTRLSLVVADELVEKLNLYIALSAHTEQNLSYEAAIDRLVSDALAKIAKKTGAVGEENCAAGQKTETKPSPASAEEMLAEKPSRQRQSDESLTRRDLDSALEHHAHEVSRSRNIPATLRRDVLRLNADRGCCYVDEKTRKRCGSRIYEQIDHVIPFSEGGAHTLTNLRVLCGAHNRWVYDQRKKFAEK